MTTPGRLKQLKRATEAALKDAKQDEVGGGINWASVHCTSARFVTDQDGYMFYQVLIEEASPGAVELHAYIARKLADEFGSVEVFTEW